MALIQFLEQCRNLILRPDQRAAYLRNIRQKSRPLAGVFSNYIPVEIFAAAGFHPVRMIGRFETSDYHGHSLYTPVCGFARDVFAAAESGAFADLECVIFPNSCDSLRVLQQMWPSKPLAYGLAHPVVADDNAVDYFAAQLRQLAERLQKEIGRDVSEAQLAEEIRRCNQTRGLLRKLYALAETTPGLFKGSDRIALVTAAMLMDRDEFNARLQQILEEVASKEPINPIADKRILLMGPLVDHLELLEAIERRGAVIVDDDVTNGRRCFDRDIELEGDLYRNLAHRYLRAAPSPTLSTPVGNDQQAFRQKLTEAKPDGVIYINQKFCEPHVHNYLSKREVLRDMNINILMLEVEHESFEVSECDLLRIESFIETIGEA